MEIGFGARCWALAAALACLLATAGSPALAGAVLTVQNTRSDPPREVQLDEAAVAALPAHTIRTRTDFTDGVTEFSGPSMTDLIALVGAEDASEARIVAANDYSVAIPVSDFTTYGVILAATANGKRLSPRGKGPYWVMYPLDDFSELQDPVYNNRLIWQVTRIELR